MVLEEDQEITERNSKTILSRMQNITVCLPTLYLVKIVKRINMNEPQEYITLSDSTPQMCKILSNTIYIREKLENVQFIDTMSFIKEK